MSAAADELRAAVETATEGTPYRMERTAEGFDLRIAVDDARWHGLLASAGRGRVVECQVRLDGQRRTLQITDAQFHVRWAADVTGRTPRLVAAEASAVRGRIWSTSREWTWRPGERPQERPVVEDRLTTTEARRLIREAATTLGWTERMGPYERAGLIAASVGLLTCLTVALLLLVGPW